MVMLLVLAWSTAQSQQPTPSGSGLGWGVFAISEEPHCTNIAAGRLWPLAIQTDGRLRNLGAGLPVSATNVLGAAGGYDHSLAVRVDGSVIAWGGNYYGQSTVPPGLTNIIAVAAGGDLTHAHSIALRNNGRAVAWGSNNSGQTNLPPWETNIVAVAAGATHSFYLRSNRTVFVVGLGQLPVPSHVTNVVAITAAENRNLALKQDGTVHGWGVFSYVPPGMSNMAAIALGANHALALHSNGTVRAWAITSSGYSAGQTNTPRRI
jgi:alpha-tubulin suppressor-like RCC1 family protein